MNPSEQRSSGAPLSALLIIMTLLGWSSVPLFIKHFSHTIDLWTSNGWRYGFSALLWLPVVVAGALRGTLRAGLWRAAVVPSVFNALGQVCFAWSFYEINPGLATFGLRLQIVFVAVGAYLFFVAERRVIRTAGYILGACMVLSGTMGTLLLSPPAAPASADASVLAASMIPAAALPAGNQAFGFALAVAAGLFFACYALSVRHYMHGTSSITAFAAISQYTAVVMVALMILLGDRSGAAALDLSAGQLGLLLLSALIGIALGHVFYYASIARLGVAVSSGVVQLQPVLVTAGSAALFGESLSAGQMVCGVLAIAGATVMLSVQHRLARRDPAAREVEESSGEQA